MAKQGKILSDSKVVKKEEVIPEVVTGVDEKKEVIPEVVAVKAGKKTIKNVKCKVIKDFPPLYIYTGRFSGKKGDTNDYPENVAIVLREKSLVI